MSNDPSTPPDLTEVVTAELVGDVVVVRVGWDMGLEHEKSRLETTVAFPRRMASRIAAAVLGVARSRVTGTPS